MTGRLTGLSTIVTGSGQGIGRGFAFAYAAEGANVIVADIKAEKAHAVAHDITAKGGAATAVHVDVSSPESVAAMVAKANETYGQIDVLLNNAAYFSPIKMKPFDEIDLAEWDLAMRVNAGGPFLCASAVAPQMRERRAGKIINICSVAVNTGRANYAHYVASKGAVLGLTRALATELGPFGITVNAISPHGIMTEIPRETVTDEQWVGLLEQQALKRKGNPEDVTGTAVFLASSDSDFITGQNIAVAAGLVYL
jgi:3-oxoacyl-[acyl-carrier protein] reductase